MFFRLFVSQKKTASMSTHKHYKLPQKQTVYFTKEEYKIHAEFAEKLDVTGIKDYLLKLYDLSTNAQDFEKKDLEISQLKELIELKDSANNDLLETIAQKSRELEEITLAVEHLAKWEALKLRLSDFRADTETAFKNLFGDENFSGVTVFDLIDLMHDYSLRDPSNEFPFEPVARKIYDRIKAENETVQTA